MGYFLRRNTIYVQCRTKYYPLVCKFASPNQLDLMLVPFFERAAPKEWHRSYSKYKLSEATKAIKTSLINSCAHFCLSKLLLLELVVPELVVKMITTAEYVFNIGKRHPASI